MRVRIDTDACTGHGRCYALAPDVFEPDEQGHSLALVDVVPEELHEQARLAVGNCPEQAITLVDE